jgi:hypothetical protein
MFFVRHSCVLDLALAISVTSGKFLIYLPIYIINFSMYSVRLIVLIDRVDVRIRCYNVYKALNQIPGN